MKKLLTLASTTLLLAACSQGGGANEADQGADSSDTSEPTTTETTETKEETSQADDTESTGKKEVVATTTQVADLVTQIGGDHVTVTQLMGPGVDPHEYQPSSSDTQALSNAEIVAYNGFHLEQQFTSLFESLDETNTHVLNMEGALDTSDVLASEEEEDDLEHDPHIWFSIENWKKAADYVAEQLSEADPDHADEYTANAENYIQELDELKAYAEGRIEEIPEQSRYLVTAHDAFQYFAEEFGFEVVGVQGLNTNTEAGTGDISDVADLIVENNIKAVFVESSVSSRNIEALIEAVESRGHEISNGGELYSDALGEAADDADTYIGMYKANVDTIVDALK